MRRKRNTKAIAADKAVREKFQRERPSLDDLLATGDFTDPIGHGEYLDLLGTLQQFKRLRQAAGLSLSDMSERTGMDRAMLSRLENGVFENPTINTLRRYARALNTRLEIRLVKQPHEPAG